GVAAYAHGAPMSLRHDVDFCIIREDAEQIADTLSKAGLHVYQPPEDWLIKARCRGEQVDLIFELAQQPIDERFLARAEELSVNSVRMPVIAATDMIGSLLAAFSEHHCDLGAVLPIARLLRAQFGSQPMPDAFLYLLERLDVIPPRGDGGQREGAPAS